MLSVNIKVGVTKTISLIFLYHHWLLKYQRAYLFVFIHKWPESAYMLWTLQIFIFKMLIRLKRFSINYCCNVTTLVRVRGLPDCKGLEEVARGASSSLIWKLRLKCTIVREYNLNGSPGGNFSKVFVMKRAWWHLHVWGYLTERK